MNTILIRLFGPFNNQLKRYIVQYLILNCKKRNDYSCVMVSNKFFYRARKWYVKELDKYMKAQGMATGHIPFQLLAHRDVGDMSQANHYRLIFLAQLLESLK